MSVLNDCYESKRMSADEIAEYVKSNYICVSPSCLGEPPMILEALTKRAKKQEFENVKYHCVFSPKGWDFTNEVYKNRLEHISWFTANPARKGVQSGIIDYMPNHYSCVPKYWNEFIDNPDVFFAVVSPMDKHGYFSFGVTASEVKTFKEKAKYIFLEVNKYMPRTFGDTAIHISEITGFCENHVPLAEAISSEPNENEAKMGKIIAELVPNGATLQLGIGGVPNAVGMYLKNKKDIGLHTELFTDSMIDLIECGVVTNKAKNIDKDFTVAAFAWGSKRMYDFMDDNVSIKMRSVDYVNNPYVIGQLDNFVSVNSCIEIDLFGQVASESIGTVPFSGSGGQVDFVRGAGLSKGGKSFIAMSSTAKGGKISKIKPVLTTGSIVTTGKNDVDYIVTENGAVRLKGKTAKERAKLIISLADEKFRDELIFEGKKLNLI